MAPSKAEPVRIIVDVHERQSCIAETLAKLGAQIEIELPPAGTRLQEHAADRL